MLTLTLYVSDFTSSQLEQDVVININLVNMYAEVNPGEFGLGIGIHKCTKSS